MAYEFGANGRDFGDDSVAAGGAASVDRGDIAAVREAQGLVALGNYADVLFSADGSKLYAVSATGVTVIDVASGATLASHAVGVSLGGADLAPDGNSLLIADQATVGGVATFYRLDLTTGAVASFSDASGDITGFSDLSFLTGTTALVAPRIANANGSVTLRHYDLATGTYTDAGTAKTPTIVASADHSRVLVGIGNITSTEVLYQSDGTVLGTLVNTPDPYAGASVPPVSVGSIAISADGSVTAFGAGALTLTNGSLQPLTSPTVAAPYLAGIVPLGFGANGQILYQARGSLLIAIDVATAAPIGAYALTSSAVGTTRGFGDIIKASADGRYISVLETSGIELIDLTTASFVITTGNDVVSGTGSLYGFGGNDSLTGAGTAFMFGGLGDDTYYVSNAYMIVTEYADQGTDIVYASVDYTLTNNVENLTLTGNGAIGGSGNALNNVINGNAQANELYGYGGADTLNGGDGNDRLDGGTGADAMTGGTGNDTYYVSEAGDTVTEAAGEGTDTVFSAIDYTLGATLENLTLTGDAFSGIGNDLANIITGNNGVNQLEGGGGNDTLFGFGDADWLDGGTGSDAMTGGTGDDSYVVDDAGDTVIETVGGGTDTVYASTSWTIAAGQAVERLSTTDIAGFDAINLTGNELANIITGNNGANRLTGGGGIDTILGGGGDDRIDGGTGTDSMTGGTGNDSFVVDSLGDKVYEAVGEGSIDRVASSVSWTMTAGQEIEQLTTADAAGTTALNLTGNEFANKIAGNEGANTLNGGGGNDKLSGGGGDDVLNGGTGVDQMAGGTGNDSYIVDDAGDTVAEASSGGVDSDTVTAMVSWSLGAGQEIERLRAGPGTDPISLTGNEFGQKIQGNDGANTLNGGGGNDNLIGGGGNDLLNGGTGLDKLTGGDGADIFAFAAGGQMDMIIDFAAGTDKIDLTAFGLTWQQVQDAMSENLGTTTIDLGSGDLIKISGVASASLGEGDFLLAGGGDSRWIDDLDARLGDASTAEVAADGPRQVLQAPLHADLWHGDFHWQAL